MRQLILDCTSNDETELAVKNGIEEVLVRQRNSAPIKQITIDQYEVLRPESQFEIESKLMNTEKEGVIVYCGDWKIIPLENVISLASRTKKRVLLYAQSKDELSYAFSVLERGVDGVIIRKEMIGEAVNQLMETSSFLKLSSAVVDEVLDAGTGERVCVDTCSLFNKGEGLLVGSTGSLLFLVHSETIENSFVPTRPFRVNAGAVHSYTLSSRERTSYLSELSAGSRVLCVSVDGKVRELTVGRVKIERRPLVLVKASSSGQEGSIVLQRAETVCLVSKEKKPVQVTKIKKGDEILAYIPSIKSRHVGNAYEEFIIEK